MKFDFKTFWNANSFVAQQSRAEDMVRGLIAIGYTAEYAKETVERFQHQAFEDGEQEESFNACGEGA